MAQLSVHMRPTDDGVRLRSVNFGGFNERAVELSVMTAGYVAIFGSFAVWVFALLWQ